MVKDKNNLIERYSAFIHSFDGSPNAFDNGEPILQEIFAPSHVFQTNDGPRSLEWFTSFAKTFAAAGNSCKVTSIEPTETGFRVTIVNTVGGVVIDPIVWDGTVAVNDDGEYKITSIAPAVDASIKDSSSNSNQMDTVAKLVHLDANYTISTEGAVVSQ